MMINVAADGALMGKEQDETYELLEEMASNNYQLQSERVTQKSVVGAHDLDANTAIQAQLALLIKQLRASNVSAIQTETQAYDLYGKDYSSGDCQVGNLFTYV